MGKVNFFLFDFMPAIPGKMNTTEISEEAFCKALLKRADTFVVSLRKDMYDECQHECPSLQKPQTKTEVCRKLLHAGHGNNILYIVIPPANYAGKDDVVFLRAQYTPPKEKVGALAPNPQPPKTLRARAAVNTLACA